MTVAAVRPTGHTPHANRWLIAAVIVLAAALVALGVYVLVHEEPAAPRAVKATPARTLDQGRMQALVMNRQDAQNSGDAARLASFYAADAVFIDAVTNRRFVGGQAIAESLTSAFKEFDLAYRAEGGPYVVGDRYLVVPFTIVSRKNMGKQAGLTAQRVEVLEIRDGKIVSDIGYSLYNQQ